MSEISKDQLLQNKATAPEEDKQVARVKPRRSWCSEQLLAIFRNPETADIFTDAAEAVRRRRVLDFLLSPGRVSAKIQDENGRLLKIDLLIKQYTEAEWRKVFQALSEQALVLALLLAGELSNKADSLLEKHDLLLCPKSSGDLILSINGQKVEKIDLYTAAVLLKFCERLDEDPFALFVLRGRGRDEVKLQLRRERQTTPDQAAAEIGPELEIAENVEADQPATKRIDSDRFWSNGEAMREITYSIRADELPAALLKRLDALPLGGLEDEVDYLLEEAYGQVTRRAQVYGLSMK